MCMSHLCCPPFLPFVLLKRKKNVVVCVCIISAAAAAGGGIKRIERRGGGLEETSHSRRACDVTSCKAKEENKAKANVRGGPCDNFQLLEIKEKEKERTKGRNHDDRCAFGNAPAINHRRLTVWARNGCQGNLESEAFQRNLLQKNVCRQSFLFRGKAIP